MLNIDKCQKSLESYRSLIYNIELCDDQRRSYLPVSLCHGNTYNVQWDKYAFELKSITNILKETIISEVSDTTVQLQSNILGKKINESYHSEEKSISTAKPCFF